MRGAQPHQVPALLPGSWRGGMGPSVIPSVANKLKIKLGTAQETHKWEGGLRTLRGGDGFPFDTNFTLTGNKTDMKGKTHEQQ